MPRPSVHALDSFLSSYANLPMWLGSIIAAYLIGSIPFGVMLGRMKGIDIREHGSRNIGATNVGRVLGRRLGMTCFALDVLKGAIPVALAGWLNGVAGNSAAELTQTQMWLWFAVAVAAVFGHMFSMFIGFRGGKGVATGFGALVAMWPLLTFPALGALVVWYVVVRLTKYISLASMLAALSLPLGSLLASIPHDAQDQPLSYTLDRLLHAYPPLMGTAAIAVLVVWKHRSNVGRLLRGEEPRVGGAARRGEVLSDPATPES